MMSAGGSVASAASGDISISDEQKGQSSPVSPKASVTPTKAKKPRDTTALKSDFDGLYWNTSSPKRVSSTSSTSSTTTSSSPHRVSSFPNNDSNTTANPNNNNDSVTNSNTTFPIVTTFSTANSPPSNSSNIDNSSSNNINNSSSNNINNNDNDNSSSNNINNIDNDNSNSNNTSPKVHKLHILRNDPEVSNRNSSTNSHNNDTESIVNDVIDNNEPNINANNNSDNNDANSDNSNNENNNNSNSNNNNENNNNNNNNIGDTSVGMDIDDVTVSIEVKLHVEEKTNSKPKTKKRRSLDSWLDGGYWTSILTPTSSTRKAKSTPFSMPALHTSSLLQSPPSTNNSARKVQKISSKQISPKRLDYNDDDVTTTTAAASPSTVGSGIELDGEYWATFDPFAARHKPRAVIEPISEHDSVYWEIRNIKNKQKKEREPETEEQKQKRMEKQAELRDERKKVKVDTEKRLREMEENSKIGKEVFPGVFLGGWRVAENSSFFKEKNIRLVINVTHEVANYHEKESVSYHKYFVTDSHDTKLDVFFAEISQQISVAIAKGNKVLVHCQEGRSRSPTILIAYAMKCLGYSLDRAYQHLQMHQPTININQGFQRQLAKYEKVLFGKNSFSFATTRKNSRLIKSEEEKENDGNVMNIEREW